jgi:N-acetylmuramoyl-L-alanine amidase
MLNFKGDIMRRNESLFFALGSLALCWCSQLQSASELTKVFYHAGGPEDTLELGKIVFYFSKGAAVAEPKIERKEPGSVIFTFEGAIVQQSVIDAARTLLHGIDKNICTAQLTSIRGKKPSIVLSVTYNPRLVGFESALFDAIQREKGFVCTLLNTPLLERLSPEKDRILRIVSHTRPHGIVIDMGHGGDDSGALSLQGIPEKDITQSIGMKVSALLRSQGFTVFCTRSDDSFVSLDTRTSFFNQCQDADVMVSIHANSGNAHASGIETFWYEPLSVPAVFLDSLSQSQRVLRHTYNGIHANKSLLLAQSVHDGVVEQVKKKQQLVVNRGVKKAISQILLGAVKPSTLIEVGFVTHPVESELLNSPAYQNLIAHGICEGILAYFKHRSA